MGIKMQYNPSTGKVSFNPVTGKVQVLNDDCVVCEDITEIELNCNFTAVCGYQLTIPATSNDLTPANDWEDELNNNTFTLTLLSGCNLTGVHDVTGLGLKHNFYTGGGCSTLNFALDIVELYFTAVYVPGSPNTMTINVIARTSAGSGGTVIATATKSFTPNNLECYEAISNITIPTPTVNRGWLFSGNCSVTRTQPT